VGWANFNTALQDGSIVVAAAAAVVAFLLYTWSALTLLTRTVYRNAFLGRIRALIRVIRFMTFGVGRPSMYRAACMWAEGELLRPRPEIPDRYRYKSDEEYRRDSAEYKLDRREWLKSARRQLGNLMSGAPDTTRKIVVPTCFDLFKNEDEIRRYFVARSADRYAFDDHVGAFHSRVEVTEGFIAPLHLLAGLLSHADDDWKPILDTYGTIMVRASDPLEYGIRSFQTFLFQCWLLWGPSIPVCTCDQWTGHSHLQFGYGDENNSIPLRIESGEYAYASPWPPRVGPQGGYPVLAVQASVTGRITGSPDIGERGFTPAQQPPGGPDAMQLVLVADGIDRPGGTPAMVAQRYYSAYLWVIFLICDEHGQPLEPDRWRNLLTFFEHGNIAEEYTYDALKRQLAHKARYSIERILRDEPTLTVRYACAIDDSGCGSPIAFPPPTGKSIKDIVFDSGWAARLNRDGLRRVYGEPPADGSYSTCHLPEVLAEYPKRPERKATVNAQEVTFVDLTASPDDVRTFTEFYSTLYVEAFPDPDERDSLGNMIDYLGLRERGWYGRSNYHILLAMVGERPVGGSIVDYLAEAEVGVIEFVLVAPEARRGGLGRQLLAETERLLAEDARRAGGTLGAVLAEINDPMVPTSKDDNVDPTDRALIWHRWGYAGLDFPYRQPALSAEQEAVTNLIMTAKPLRQDWRDGLPSATVRCAVSEYLRLAMRIKEPAASPDFAEMASYLAGRAVVPTIPLDAYVGHATDALRITSVHGAGTYAWRVEGDGGVEGTAAVFRLADGGFAGQVTLTEASAEVLRPVVARMEDRMLHDRPVGRGWYVRVEQATDVCPFREIGCEPVAEEPIRLLYKPYGRSYGAARPATAEVARVVAELTPPREAETV
jgi:GNAT superfamily N-acetyltransferase